uniref:Uncharacterized protein n=1 Tax=Moniliophthora roreri TaxID=221103 RepID=A0A0W0FFG8_MONRR
MVLDAQWSNSMDANKKSVLKMAENWARSPALRGFQEVVYELSEGKDIVLRTIIPRIKMTEDDVVPAPRSNASPCHGKKRKPMDVHS